jgi:hypothetical protein
MTNGNIFPTNYLEILKAIVVVYIQLKPEDTTPVSYYLTRGYKVTNNLFFPSAIRLWNELPTAVVTASTLEGFKDSLQTIAIY